MRPSEVQGLAQVALLLSRGLGLPSFKSLLLVTTLPVTQLLPHTHPQPLQLLQDKGTQNPESKQQAE